MMKKMRWILSVIVAAALWIGSVPISGLAQQDAKSAEFPVQLLEADEDGDGTAAAKGFSTLTEALTYIETQKIIPEKDGSIHLNVQGDILDKGGVWDLSDDKRISKLIIQGDGSDGRAVKVDTGQTTAPKESNKAVEFDIVLPTGGQLEISNLIFPHNMVFDAVAAVSDHTKKVYVHDCTFYGTWIPTKACVSGEYRFVNNSWKDFQGYCVWIKTEGSKDISYDFIFEKNDVRRYRVFNSATDNKAIDCGIVNVTMLDNSFVHEREYTQETGSCMALCQISGWINGKIDIERNTMIGYYRQKNCVPALLVQYNPDTSGIKDGSDIIIKDNLRQCDVVIFAYHGSSADKTEALKDHTGLTSSNGVYTSTVKNNQLVHMYPEISKIHNCSELCHICKKCNQAIVNITTDGNGVIIDKSLPSIADVSGEVKRFSESLFLEADSTAAVDGFKASIDKTASDTGSCAVGTLEAGVSDKAAGEQAVSQKDNRDTGSEISKKLSDDGTIGAAEGNKNPKADGAYSNDSMDRGAEENTGSDMEKVLDTGVSLFSFQQKEDSGAAVPVSSLDETVVSGKIAVVAYNYQDSAKDYVPNVKRNGVVVDVDKEKTFTAVPDPGFELEDFLVNGESVKDELEQDEDGYYCWTFCNYGGLEQCPEIYASFTGTYTVSPEDDTIVLDYGLAVALTDEKADWNIYSNDNLTNCRVTGVTFDASDLQYGVLVEQDGVYYYKPTSIMQKQEKIRYTVTQLQVNGMPVSLPEGEQETKDITIVPASIVFYEPDILADKKSDITVQVNKVQDAADDEIGFDAVYAATASNGKCVEVAFDERKENGRDSGFRFTFTGVGADIIGITNTDSGKLAYYVTDETGMAVQVGVIDSYYSANGTDGIEHVPVAAIRMNERGTYTVTVNIHEAGATAHQENSGSSNSSEGETDWANQSGKEYGTRADEFILQGIRIYSTLTKKQYYELDPAHYLQETASILNVRELLEGTQAAMLSTYEGEGLEAYGVTIVENIEETTVDLTNELTDYLNRGPANEVYLGEHMSYAFVAEVEDPTQDYVLSVEARTIGIGDGGDSEKMRIAAADTNGGTKEFAAPGTVAMYYAVDLKECISLGGQKYLVVIEGAGNDRNAISLSGLKVNNLRITCPYMDQKAMALIHTAQDESICRIAVQKAEQITTVVTRSKKVEFNVFLNASDITDETVIHVYCNGKCIGIVETADPQNINTGKSSEQTYVYRAYFKAPSTKGSYNLTFYANDGCKDSIYGYETVLKVR